MIQHFVWWAFLLGLVFGFIGIYFVGPNTTAIMKYPTPELAAKLVYRDNNGVCYKYTTKEVNCDSNESRMKSFPLG